MTELPSLPSLPELPALDSPRRRVPTSGARRVWQVGTVLEVRQETPRARTYRVGLPTWVPHLPGQNYLVRLTAPDGYRAQRSYSAASAPDDVGVVELTVEVLPGGEVSGYLHHHVGVGDALEVRGPFGGWFVWRGDTPALLVGGGSGVVPLAAMLRTRAARATLHDGTARMPLHLVVSARRRVDLLYADELTGPLGDDVTVVLTREEQPGRRPGRLRADDLAPHVERLGARLGPDTGGADVFVCGSTSFTTAAEALLQDVGVPASAIRVERFGPT